LFAKEVLFQNAKIRRKKVLFDVKFNFQKQEKSMFLFIDKIKFLQSSKSFHGKIYVTVHRKKRP